MVTAAPYLTTRHNRLANVRRLKRHAVAAARIVQNCKRRGAQSDTGRARADVDAGEEVVTGAGGGLNAENWRENWRCGWGVGTVKRGRTGCEGCEGVREGVVVRLRARTHTRRVLPHASPGGRVDDSDVSSGGNAVQRFDAKGCGKVEVWSEMGFETKGVWGSRLKNVGGLVKRA